MQSYHFDFSWTDNGFVVEIPHSDILTDDWELEDTLLAIKQDFEEYFLPSYHKENPEANVEEAGVDFNVRTIIIKEPKMIEDEDEDLYEDDYLDEDFYYEDEDWEDVEPTEIRKRIETPFSSNVIRIEKDFLSAVEINQQGDDIQIFQLVVYLNEWNSLIYELEKCGLLSESTAIKLLL